MPLTIATHSNREMDPECASQVVEWPPPDFDGVQPKRVIEIDRIAAGEAIEVQAAGEAEGIFLRKPSTARIIVPIALVLMKEKRRASPSNNDGAIERRITTSFATSSDHVSLDAPPNVQARRCSFHAIPSTHLFRAFGYLSGGGCWYNRLISLSTNTVRLWSERNARCCSRREGSTRRS